MKEKEFINIIKNVLNSKYIGDDCAYLKDLGIVISQDSLVEGVHFRRDFTTPYKLGYKSVMVNVSDICASGAKPKYLTISLSLPNDINSEFVEEFYNGARYACGKDIEIVGGDITFAEKIYISISIIGDAAGKNISSRKNAQEGYKIVVCGEYGSSAAGLELLLQNKKEPVKFINAHLEPRAQLEFSQKASENIYRPYAMMDTSDGLMDALSAIANDSNVLLEIDFDKIPYDKDIEQFSNWYDMIMFGGEDYGLVAVVPYDFNGGIQIGNAKQGSGVNVHLKDKTIHYSKQDVENKIYNHFK